MNKKAGRKKLTFDEQQLYEVIRKYREQTGNNGRLKYMKVYQFHLQLFEEGLCTEKYSEDFWRKSGRPGREAIDVANRLAIQELANSKNETVVIPNVSDAVDKYSSDKEKLKKALIPMETQLFDSLEREKKWKERADILEEELKKEKLKRDKAEVLVGKYEELLYKVFRYSGHSDVSLKNMLNTGVSRNKLVGNALKTAFDNPLTFIDKFESNKNQNVIPLEKKQKTMADDFKNMF